jgi:outer membrane lipoprotein-sorting protein
MPDRRCQIAGMRRRHLFFLLPLLAGLAANIPASVLAAAALTPADRADLARIEAYLNSLKTLHARFIQVAPNGAVSRGQAWLERPGRMRFQYDPPSPLLLVAGHGRVVFHDAALNQTSDIPLNRTPLGILLADNIRLSGDVTVTGMTRSEGQIQVSLTRTAAPADGTLILSFIDNPLTLRQWTVIDAQRQETGVTLYDITLGGEFNQNLFTLEPNGK